ncbi:MAG: efflux RND transporter periplasmic adaptor subunit [gamma proteobacterium symbiont of Lucinoma myriamae]|nr:efflux RND transporter periplasmic adaptor subunit [gamma proteobacterium symbiont of Lucinoma myriamae]MCU7818426.1 efflux RND transporter periplasmic adaptor subunit [gamma proteobacterium symbiont of Lucinoma myriamae]
MNIIVKRVQQNKFFFILSVIICYSLISGCQKESEKDSSLKERSVVLEKSIPVTLIKPVQQDIDITLHAVGRIESLSSPIISGETNGKVISIHVDEGDAVKEGELLAILDDRLLEILQAQEKSEIKRIQILIENKKITLNRRTKLAKTKSISQDSVDETQTELSSFLAQETLLNNKLAAIQYKLDKTKIKSPINSTVVKRYISKGDYIKEDEHLFKLVSLSRLRIRLPVPENKVPSLSVGQSVLLSTPSSSQKTQAKISRLLPLINQKNKAIEIIIDIDNPGDWRPGATVLANIILEHFNNALLLPQQSIVKRPSGDVVYVYDGLSKTVKQRIIKTGNSITLENVTSETNPQTQSLIQIISGVKTSDQVVVNGASYLTDNAKVSLVIEQGR